MIERRNNDVDKNNKVNYGTKKWIKRIAIVLLFVVCLGVVIIASFGDFIENVPYTNRKRFRLFLTSSMERKFINKFFEAKKLNYGGETLPPTDPDSVRAQLVANKIIKAFHPKPEPKHSVRAQLVANKIIKAFYLKPEPEPEPGVGKHKVTSSDEHLEEGEYYQGLNWKWKVIVVNKTRVNAYSLADGSIVVFSDLMKHFKSDDELAVIIGYEVGHVVAGHFADRITKVILYKIIKQFLKPFLSKHYIRRFLSVTINPLSRRKNEMEADYIGLLLMASAGYDPRIAPGVYEKLHLINNPDSEFTGNRKKRANLLAQPHIMDEALKLYREGAHNLVESSITKTLFGLLNWIGIV